VFGIVLTSFLTFLEHFVFAPQVKRKKVLFFLNFV